MSERRARRREQRRDEEETAKAKLLLMGWRRWQYDQTRFDGPDGEREKASHWRGLWNRLERNNRRLT